MYNFNKHYSQNMAFEDSIKSPLPLTSIDFPILINGTLYVNIKKRNNLNNKYNKKIIKIGNDIMYSNNM